MKYLVAIDSYKGCMSSLEAGNAARQGILRKYPDAEVAVKALADGGEGTRETLTEALGGTREEVSVHDPLGRMIKAHYGILGDRTTAVMEMAESSGITLVTEAERDPWNANTCGFGEMLKAAYEKGCRKYIIGIGGSATSEAGIGMLGALGFRFLNKEGRELPLNVRSMDQIAGIDDTMVDSSLLNADFRIACDVTNPLCGANGAVSVYGPQKGVGKEDIPLMDDHIRAFSRICTEYAERIRMTSETDDRPFDDKSAAPGAGAAGGLGFAFMNFFPNASLQSGAEMVMDLLGIEEELRNTDVLITGEGRIDGQTASGKGPMKLALLAKKYGCRTYAFAGQLGDGAEKCADFFDKMAAISPEDMPFSEAMRRETAIENMIRTVGEQI